MPFDSAWTILNNLGTVSAIEFIDSQDGVPEFNRHFHNYSQRAESLLERLGWLNCLMLDFGMEPGLCREHSDFLEKLNSSLETRDQAEHTYFDEMEDKINGACEKLTDSVRNYELLLQNIGDCKEYKTVLELIKPHIPTNFKYYQDTTSDEEPSGMVNSVRFGYMCGVIATIDRLKFNRTIWRVTRDNALVKFIDMPVVEDRAGKPVRKSIYFICYPMSDKNVLQKKLNRLCESYNATKWRLPETMELIDEKIHQLGGEVKDLEKTTTMTKTTLTESLAWLALPDVSNDFSAIEELRISVMKEKLIYENMNKMVLKDRILYAKFWCTTEQEELVRKTLDKLPATSAGKHIAKAKLEFKNYKDTGLTPPTHFKLNDFTAPFQEVVTTYGTPRYREVNPGLFTIVTFPFQFGVMFGDIGHGGWLFIMGCLAVIFNQNLKHTAVGPLMNYRFLFFLAGWFALWCGLIYNDFFAIPLNLWGSCYDEDFERESHDCTYPLGIDPVWYQSSTEIGFLNSLKMKLSIVIGVCHMSFGIILKAFNAVHFNNPVDFIFEFIPQILFFMCTFGYMVFCIVIKWLTNWEGRAPPSIINIYTDGGVANASNVLWGSADGLEQTNFQQSIFLIAACLAPIMLFPKPIIVHWQNSRKTHQAVNELETGLLMADDEDKGPQKKDAHAEESFGEIMIHQMIETIEFILGCISNTASYLRLWA